MVWRHWWSAAYASVTPIARIEVATDLHSAAATCGRDHEDRGRNHDMATGVEGDESDIEE